MTRKYLVTGGAGFIGSNYVHRLIQRGEHVTIFDIYPTQAHHAQRHGDLGGVWPHP